MAEGNLHIVAMPRWSSFVGVARLVIALLVLVLVAAAAGIWYTAIYAAFGLTLFTAAATLIIFGYYLVSLGRKPELYNAWAILGLEVFGVIFWLVSFALCAEWTAAFNHDTRWTPGKNTNYGFWNAPFKPEDIGLESRALTERATNKWKASVGLMGAAAGLGALEFALFGVVLGVFSLSLHKHRVAGKPFIPGGARSVPSATPEKPTIVTASPEISATNKGKDREEVPQVNDKMTELEVANKDGAAAMV